MKGLKLRMWLKCKFRRRCKGWRSPRNPTITGKTSQMDSKKSARPKVKGSTIKNRWRRTISKLCSTSPSQKRISKHWTSHRNLRWIMVDHMTRWCTTRVTRNSLVAWAISLQGSRIVWSREEEKVKPWFSIENCYQYFDFWLFLNWN